MSGRRKGIAPAVLICLAMLAALTGCGDPVSPPEAGETAVLDSVDAATTDSAFSYESYDRLLGAYVDDEGYVDYRGLMAERNELDKFVASMGRIKASEFDEWSESERLALWINAYNAITLKYILDHYPIKKGNPISGLRYPKNSIRQISGVWTKLTSAVVGREYTLEDIENEIIRKDFDEPRIHMAIVCASIGCPQLRDEAFVGEKLEEQLEDQSRAFAGNPGKFRIDRERGRVHVSKIFRWFGKDFVGVYGTDKKFRGHDAGERAVLNFLSRHLSKAEAAYLDTAEYNIAYEDYDWSLNER